VLDKAASMRPELERAAAARGPNPKVLLNSIGRVVVRDGLINAVLDDMPSDAMHSL
jgi:hypothetical protein